MDLVGYGGAVHLDLRGVEPVRCVAELERPWSTSETMLLDWLWRMSERVQELDE